MIKSIINKALNHNSSRNGNSGQQGRILKSELKKLIRALDQSQMLNTLLEWVDGFVMVLNRQRQILKVGGEWPEFLADQEMENLIGKRPGEIFGCVNVDKGPDGCGTSDSCKHCGALCGILTTIDSGENVESGCKITVHGSEGEESGKYKVNVSKVQVEDFEVTLVLFKNISQAGRYFPGFNRKKTVQHFPGYEKIRTLGTGAMGSVYLVRNEEGKQFALKTIHPELITDNSQTSRFRNETKMALDFKHRNIVETYEVGTSKNGVLYMVSEYCPNGCLYRVLQEMGTLPVNLALFWMIDASHGLDYIWRNFRIVHRDIKPDNLLLTKEHRIKIADFGIARDTGFARRLTAADLLIGTPHYMSPEQGDGARDQDVRTDLYSLGATFYHLLTGRVPYEANTPWKVIEKAATQPLPPVTKTCSSIPSQLADCIECLMEKNKEDRYQDA
ncbi:MAG: serine/threonine protein kinase, partial [Planctomycetota bacterium]